MAFCGGILAVSCRQQMSQDDLLSPIASSSAHEDALAQLLEMMANVESEAAVSSAQSRAQSSGATFPAESVSSSNTSLDSLSVQNAEKENLDTIPATRVENTTDISEPWEMDSGTDSLANSAETFWSDGSSRMSSDDFQDDDQWNDWGNERLVLEDLKEQAEGSDYAQSGDDDSSDDEHSGISLHTESELDVSSDESDANVLEVPGTGLRLKASTITDEREDSESDDSIMSHFSQSCYGTSEDEEQSDEEHEGKVLEDLLFGRRTAGKSTGARHISIRIYDTGNKQQKPIFHFSQRTDRQLFSSPPKFHPSKPLLVWPLGAGEVLFANYQDNTYFTRVLCSSGFGSCQVFVKSHFSSNGEYLHFAALEVQPADDDRDPDSKIPPQVLLTLQVSTHRLSRRKTVWSPPHLIARTNILLGKTHSVSVSALPYTLTWTDQYLYFVKRDVKLNVIRIPLFRPSEPCEKTVTCRPRNDIHLPRTAALRDVYYHPPSASGKRSKEDQGLIIIGSYSSLPAQRILVPRQSVSPPIGAFISEQTDFGGWVCRADTVSTDQRWDNDGARLRGKFERFNLTEDCDIVPYLA